VLCPFLAAACCLGSSWISGPGWWWSAEEYCTLYHGTSRHNAAAIRNDGIIPSLKEGIRHTAFGEGTYWTTDPQHARGFAGPAGVLMTMQIACSIWRMLDVRPLSTHLTGFFAPVDVIRATNRWGVDDLILKQRGVEKLKGVAISFSDGSPPTSLRLSQWVYTDYDGGAAARMGYTYDDLLSRNERQMVLRHASQYLGTLVLLKDRVFWLATLAHGMLTAFHHGVRNFEDLSVSLARSSGMAVGNVVGCAAGGAMGAALGAWAVTAASFAVSQVCPLCPIIGAYLGGDAGCQTGQVYFGELFADLSEHTARTIWTYTRNLVSKGGNVLCGALAVLNLPCVAAPYLNFDDVMGVFRQAVETAIREETLLRIILAVELIFQTTGAHGHQALSSASPKLG